MTDFTAGSPMDKIEANKKEIDRLRRDVDGLDAGNRAKYVQGRLRTDRTTPASNSDVLASDKEGDVVRTSAYEYVVVNDSGTLKWGRSAISVGW